MQGRHVLGADAQESSPDRANTANVVRGSIPSVVLSEFVASMLQQEQEPRLKKMLIMSQVEGFDAADELAAADATVPCFLLNPNLARLRPSYHLRGL